METSKYTEQNPWKNSEWVIYGEGFLPVTILNNECIHKLISRFYYLLKRLILRNSSEWLLPSNLHLVYIMLVQHFIVLSLFQFLMTSSEFTEHFPWLNKVNYPISGRNYFTVLLLYVMGQQDYVNEKCPHFTVYGVFPYFFFFLLMEADLQEFVDCFKLTNDKFLL